MKKKRMKFLLAFSIFAGTMLLSFGIYFFLDLFWAGEPVYLYHTRFRLTDIAAFSLSPALAGFFTGLYVSRFREGLPYIVFTWGAFALSLVFLILMKLSWPSVITMSECLELLGFFLLAVFGYLFLLALVLKIRNWKHPKSK